MASANRKQRPARRAGRKPGAASGAGRTPKPRPQVADRLKNIRRALDLTQPAMARVLGISQRKLSELENAGRQPRPETRRRLTEVERLHSALAEIIETDELAGWLEQPNPGFDGASPLQLIERGEVDRLWQMVYSVRTGHPL